MNKKKDKMDKVSEPQKAIAFAIEESSKWKDFWQLSESETIAFQLIKTVNDFVEPKRCMKNGCTKSATKCHYINNSLFNTFAKHFNINKLQHPPLKEPRLEPKYISFLPRNGVGEIIERHLLKTSTFQEVKTKIFFEKIYSEIIDHSRKHLTHSTGNSSLSCGRFVKQIGQSQIFCNDHDGDLFKPIDGIACINNPTDEEISRATYCSLLRSGLSAIADDEFNSLPKTAYSIDLQNELARQNLNGHGKINKDVISKYDEFLREWKDNADPELDCYKEEVLRHMLADLETHLLNKERATPPRFQLFVLDQPIEETCVFLGGVKQIHFEPKSNPNNPNLVITGVSSSFHYKLDGRIRVRHSLLIQFNYIKATYSTVFGPNSSAIGNVFFRHPEHYCKCCRKNPTLNLLLTEASCPLDKNGKTKNSFGKMFGKGRQTNRLRETHNFFHLFYPLLAENLVIPYLSEHEAPKSTILQNSINIYHIKRFDLLLHARQLKIPEKINIKKCCPFGSKMSVLEAMFLSKSSSPDVRYSILPLMSFLALTDFLSLSVGS